MQRTIYPCNEFSPIRVPLADLFVGDSVNIYPETSKYFDLDWRAGALVIAPKSYVGLIPVNDRIAIRVLPRFPIKNLFWILNRASAKLDFINGHFREYEVAERDPLDPIEVLARRLTLLCQECLRSGLLRRYIKRSVHAGMGSSLNFSETVSAYRSRGVRHTSVWDESSHSPHLLENQLLKAAMSRVLAYYSQSKAQDLKRFSATAAEVLFLLDGVPPLPASHTVTERDVVEMVSRLPDMHRAYGGVLWLAYLLHARRGISIENIGSANFETFVVNLAEVFEDYVRQVVSDGIATIYPGARVKNGNQHSVKLFAQGDPNKVQPDVYLVSGGSPVAVMDAKYKPKLKAEDRYEVMAFCEALEVSQAVFLMPGSGPASSQLLGRTVRGTTLYTAKIDLAAENMQSSEADFVDTLKNILFPVH